MRRALLLAALLAALAAAGVAAGASGTTIDHDGANLTLEAGANQTVTGETELAPGTPIKVRILSTDPANPYLFQAETNVTADGTFAATLDLSDAPANTTFNATVYGDGRTLTETTGVLQPCGEGCTVTRDQPEEPEGLRYEGENLTLAAGTQQVVVGSADLPAGTTVRVRLQSTDATSPFLRSAPATVHENGTFAAVFDLSNVANGTSMEAFVHYDGENVASATGRVVACEGDCADPVPAYAGETEVAPPENEAWNGTGVALRPTTAVRQGESVGIPLSLDGAETVRLTLGNESLGYEFVAEVSDTDGDGEATVVFHTGRAGTDGATLTARGDDGVNLVSESSLPSTIDPATYPLALAHANGTRADTATLTVTDDDEPDQRYGSKGWTGETFGLRESIATGHDVIEVGVGFGDASAATLTVNGEGYEANLTVRDGDGNGTAVVAIHPDPANADGAVFVARDADDSVEVVAESGESLAPGTYDLSLRRGLGGAVDDIGTLSVQAGPSNGTEPAENDTTERPPAQREPDGAGGFPGPLDGVAALAVGALLAIGGIGLIIGGFRR